MTKSLTDVLADGLTAALVELIAIGKGADVLKAIGNLERGAVISGEADAILESAGARLQRKRTAVHSRSAEGH